MTPYPALVTVVGYWSSITYTNRNLKAKIVKISKSNLENIWSMWCIDRPKIDKNGHIISFHVHTWICSISLALFPYFFAFYRWKSLMKMIDDFVWKLNGSKFEFSLHRDHFISFCHPNTISQYSIFRQKIILSYVYHLDDVLCSMFIIYLFHSHTYFSFCKRFVCSFRITSSRAGMDSERIPITMAFLNRDTKHEKNIKLKMWFVVVFVMGAIWWYEMAEKNVIKKFIVKSNSFWQGSYIGAAFHSNFRLYVERNVEYIKMLYECWTLNASFSITR